MHKYLKIIQYLIFFKEKFYDLIIILILFQKRNIKFYFYKKNNGKKGN